ncbi:MAG: diguanylate cyclase [Nitrospirae bacterium]|nr:diguanylate cyclase [Nitrospirota bacterium]
MVRTKRTEQEAKKPPVILIVDDEEGINHLMEKILQREGFLTESVLNGEDAINRVMSDPRVILILDFRLSDMTGKDVIITLGKKGVKVPFIIITGRGDENLAVVMMKLGAKDYIVKEAGFSGMLPYVLKRVIHEIEQEERVLEAQKESLARQTELSLIYKVSSSLSQTLDFRKFFDLILNTLIELDIPDFEKRGGIFLVDEDRMTLIPHKGQSESFINMHKGLRVGECLCGLAAKTGEVIVSKNCHKDKRHSIMYPHMEDHGHVIMPLKAMGKVVGVLFLYLRSDFNLEEGKMHLLYSIANQIGVSIHNGKLFEETKRFALHDPLTGLANRRHMHLIFSKGLAKARRAGEPFSVIMLDIDFFKKYNDEKGHREGDNLLMAISNILLKESREVDLVVRYGGEEFIILLPDTDLGRAIEVAERLRHAVETRTDTTISLGVASLSKSLESEDVLIDKADTALYLAKQNGRNRVEVSS